MKRTILVVFLLFSGAFVITACAKIGEYKTRPAKTSEIGMQAICPVTSNVFNVNKETTAVDYKGKTYFLCCPDCSADFQKKLGIAVKSESRDLQGMKGMEAVPAAPVTSAGDKEIMYWTCPMHPQVKEKGLGKCPICSMDLVSVYKKEGNRIAVDPAKGKLLGLKNEAAREMTISKTVRLPARVAYDNDLYMSQQEYLLSVKNFSSFAKATEDKSASPAGLSADEAGEAGHQAAKSDIIEASKFRLKLLGYTDNDIKALERQAQPDKTLLLPGDKAWLFVDVYENDLQSVKPGKEMTAIIDAYPSAKFRGKVMFIEPSLNPETRSAKARIMVDNPGNILKLEMFAKVEITMSNGPLLAVPKTAVIDTGIRKIVYVDFGNGEYELRDVKTGFEGDDQVEIKDGLKAGDLVVTNGNFMLDSESQLKASSNQGSATSAMEGMNMGGKK